MKKALFLITAFFAIGLVPLAYSENEDKLAVLETKSGIFVIEFFPNDAPNHVDNFITLVEDGFYNKTVFHRVIKDFMIQGGDPKTKPGEYSSVNEWGTGGPDHRIDAEFNDIQHDRGIVSMARSADPNSAGSQFFIVHADSNFLDGAYTVFGRLVTQESFDTLDKIANLETPPNVTIPVNWGDAELISAKIVQRDSIEGVLDLGEPERTSGLAPPPETGSYTDERFGITFDIPEGWLLQQPEKTSPFVPDLVMLGPANNQSPQAVSITVEPKNDKNLDDKITESDEMLQAEIDAGLIQIISEEKTTINGAEAHQKTLNSSIVYQGNNVNLKFHEVILAGLENFYTITYINEESRFNDDLGNFNDVLNSFSYEDRNTNTENGGGCLIATATYGSELAPQVQLLREVRDNTLLSTESGSSFMSGFNTLYYSFSPAIADLERQNPVFREAVKLFLTPMLSTLSIMTLAEQGSESSVLGLGISVIALNLGIYVIAPAVIISRMRR